ncbi:acyltransferase [Companilactobacillus pabuli]|uniref:Acyltransferase n=1 Tax=Companilactobacillus pabuli TaxID=2714036 RepID=A0A7L7KTY7_9LACO|nr:acyltransferase [Companilactobacillus pabuli]QMT83263.1 acyltransferase [Companilactobacillus pabuli]
MKGKRIVYIDFIRVLAMFLVVLAHSCASRLEHGVGSVDWNVAHSLVIITEIAVPLFFMISGSTILNSPKTRSIRYLFKHRLPKILVPFIIWSIITAYFARQIDGTYTYHSFMQSILSMYHQPVIIAYWFIYPLISLYLLSPLLKAMVDSLSSTGLTYLLILWFFFMMIIPAIIPVLPSDIRVYFKAYSMSKIVFSSYLGYFLLGYKLSQEKHRKTNWLVGILLILILFTVNIEIGLIDNKSLWKILNIFSIGSVPFIAGLIFVILRSFENKYHHWFSKLIEILAPLTYGVYLIHGLVINLVEQWFGTSAYFTNFLLTSLISLVVIFILSKIPLIRKILL